MKENGEQIKWITEKVSSGDLCHSECHSADTLAFSDETYFSMEDASLSGTSTCSHEAAGITPPKRMKMATSQRELSIPQISSVHHSFPILQQDNKRHKEHLVSDELSSGSESIQSEFDDVVLETKQIDANLNRLEVISDKIDKLNGRNDNLDNFGRYVASLLQCLPFQRAMELQHEVITLILRSHINLSALEDAMRYGSSSLQDMRTLPETSSSVTLKPPSTSALTPEVVGMPLSTSQRSVPSLDTSVEQNDMSIKLSLPSLQQDNKGGKRCPQRLAPCEDHAKAQSTSVHQSSLPLHQHKNNGNKRPWAESEVSSELQNKQSKFDELLQTIRIEAALKKLEGISDKAKQLYRMDDHFDNFARYVASLLKWLPTLRTMELQQEVINLILRLHINPLIQVQ